MDELQMISSNDWQDCYRIMNGYLFIVNKFVEIDDMGTTYTIPKNYYKKVDQKAKGKLWILIRPVKRYGGYKDCELLEPNEENGEFPIGTVFYNEKPIKKIDSPYWYDCFVRAAWDNLHWNVKSWEIISGKIQEITKIYLKEKSYNMEQNYIQHGDDFVVITGNARCTNGDCPYIKYVGDCPGDIENCEYRQQRNDAFINYTFDGI